MIKKNYNNSEIKTVVDDNNYGILIGQRCDFYIYLKVNERSHYSNWIKGRKASELWDDIFVNHKTNPVQTFDKLKNIFTEVGSNI